MCIYIYICRWSARTIWRKCFCVVCVNQRTQWEKLGTHTSHCCNWFISRLLSLCVFDGTVQRRRTCWRKLRNSSAVCPTLPTARTRDSVMRWDQWVAAKLLWEVWLVRELRCFMRETPDMCTRCTCACRNWIRKYTQYCASILTNIRKYPTNNNAVSHFNLFFCSFDVHFLSSNYWDFL